MDRKEMTKRLSALLEQHLKSKDSRVYLAREVTFDYSTASPIRVDYMLFKPLNNTISGIEKGSFYCYEIKSCIQDFLSKHGHNFIGDYNYYVMPKELYDTVADEIPYDVGVYIDSLNMLIPAKIAKRRDRKKPICEMLLMMFRSCNRDFIKNKEKDNGL